MSVMVVEGKDCNIYCLVVLDINMEARSMIGIWMRGSIEGGLKVNWGVVAFLAPSRYTS